MTGATTMRRRAIGAMLCAVLTLPAAVAQGVQTSHWVHTNAADFKAGKFENVVATNFGDLKLSRKVTQLLEQDPHVSVVYCLAEAPDGTVYAGTGPSAPWTTPASGRSPVSANAPGLLASPSGGGTYSSVVDPASPPATSTCPFVRSIV